MPVLISELIYNFFHYLPLLQKAATIIIKIATMITIQELLEKRDLPKNAKIKLVRHKSNKIDLKGLYQADYKEFMRYQSAQSTHVFQNIDYIVALLGEEGSLSRFIGVYKVGKEQPISDADRYSPQDKYYYPLDKVDGFKDIEEKIIVKWIFSRPRSWYEDYRTELEVVELSPGLYYQHFPGYLNVVLTFTELKDIIKHKYTDWKKMLSSVYGVYCICDRTTGKLYIGSAYSKDKSIWGRWELYVNTGGCCDNKKLKALIENNPSYANNFTFSILAIISKSATDKEVINIEAEYKRKFDTIKHGLNEN